VGRDTLVGIGARLLSGCDIGEECLIAAGALVTEGRRIPPRSVVMGVPGKIVREITPDELERTRSICAHYLEMAQRYARGSYPPPGIGWGRRPGVKPDAQIGMPGEALTNNKSPTMSPPADPVVLTPKKATPAPAEPAADRRSDVDSKQVRIAGLLQEVG